MKAVNEEAAGAAVKVAIDIVDIFKSEISVNLNIGKSDSPKKLNINRGTWLNHCPQNV